MAVPDSPRLQVEVVKAVPSPVAPSFVRSVLARTASVPEVGARLPAGTTSIAVRSTGDRDLRRLNKSYAGLGARTDVWAFAGSGTRLGDRAISWPMVRRQAAEFK